MNKKCFQTIASYEAKTLSREWDFRFLAGLAVICVGLLQLLTQSNFNRPDWASISLISSIPYANAYLIVHIQTFLTIFLAGRFLYKRKNSDTVDAIRTRPYTNTEYLWGKAFGFLRVMCILDGILMSIALLIHLFASDSPWAFYPYIFYFFTLTLPALLFVTGLTIAVKSLIRHQGLALVVLLAYFYWEVAHSASFLQGSFDLMASSLPNTFSEWTGFSGLSRYLTQRALFPLWGIGLLLLSIGLQSRLHDKQKTPYLSQIAGSLLLLIGLIPVWTYTSSFTQEQAARETARQLFAKYEQQPKAVVKNHHIRFQQSGTTYSANSRITLSNPHEATLSSLILYLNPGLTVKQITLEGEPVGFQREGQIVELTRPLEPGEEQVFEISYEGHLSQAVCYAEYERPEDFPPSRNRSFFNYGKEMFFLQNNFTLLTPEILWYPTSMAPVNVISPYATPKTFTDFSLEVIGENKRTVISQGEAHEAQDTVRFSNFQKLTGLSLCMGNYTQLTESFDSLTSEAYLFKGHEQLFKNVDKQNLKKALKNQLKPEKEFPWMEVKTYPLHKIALVEIPVNFCAYARFWKDESELLQPELIFRPELEATSSKNPLFNPNSREYENLEPEKTAENSWVEIFKYLNSFRTSPLNINNLFLKALRVESQFIQLKNEQSIASMWESHLPYIHSPEFEGIDMILNQMPHMSEDVLKNREGLSTTERAYNYLKKKSLADALNDSKIPQATILNLMQGKTQEWIKELALILPSYREFEKFIKQAKESHPFSALSFEQLCREYQEQSGIDILPSLRELYHKTGVPFYLIRDEKFQETENEQGEKIVISSFKIWNKSQNDGIICVSNEDGKAKLHRIPAGEVKEIKSVGPHPSLSMDPDSQGGNKMRVNITMGLAANMPNRYEYLSKTCTQISGIPETGTFDADTSAFAPLPGEYIVDNDSEGFQILNNKSKLKKFLGEEEELLSMSSGPSPKEWTRFTEKQAHGDGIKSFHSKLSGAGTSNVEWNTHLSEAGEYELFVFMNDHFNKSAKQVWSINKEKRSLQMTSESRTPTQTYLFLPQGGEKSVSLETTNYDGGWVSLGKYTFPAGPTKITLTDLGTDPGQNLYADAVKWIRVK